MKLRAPHWIGIGLIALGVIAVLVVQLTGIGRAGGGDDPFRRTTEVTGVVGSEKVAFFEDPEVQQAFAAHGYSVRVTKSGSWRMADLPTLESNDFAFPASQLAADHIEQTHAATVLGVHQPFFSPMAIATFEPVMELLERNGAASKDATGAWQLDMAAYLDLVDRDARWNQLDGAQGLYPSPRSILITSTDIRTSNSAGMYLSLAAYAASGSSVVRDRAQADALLPKLSKLFLAQGYSGSSSTAPFEDYLNQGIGSAPMVMIYEGQFLEEQLKPASRIGASMVLAYPSPTAFSAHTGVSLSEDGEAVMQLLDSDPQLAQLMARHGFRPQGANAAAFQQLLQAQGLDGSYRPASGFVNIAQEPSYEMLDYLLAKIGESYSLSGAPPATSEGTAPPGDPAATPPATEPNPSETPGATP